jgi:N-acetylglucosamine-6-sulfatase
MTFNLFLRLVGLLLLSAASTQSAKAAPNFVVILTDDQDDTGSMAYMRKTLSLLGEHGVTFKNSFVNFSLCAPSRASFFTGQAAHNHGIKSDSLDEANKWNDFKQGGNGNALPVWLKAAGYRTAFIGKYHALIGEYHFAKSESPPNQVPPGWDLWFAITGHYFDYKINADGKTLSFDHQTNDYSTDVLKDRAVKFIGDQSGRTEPFFMLIATTAPHGDVEKGVSTPAPRHAGLFSYLVLPKSPAFNEQDVSDKPRWVSHLPELNTTVEKRIEKRYKTEIESLQAVDDLVEAVHNALRDAGKLDDTIIIFTSDNGYMLGEHRLEGKIAVYEGSVRVPLLIRGPGIPENQTRVQLVNNLDVVATIEELAGVTPGRIPDGHSLTPLFTSGDAPWRSALLMEGGHGKSPVVVSDSWIGTLEKFFLGRHGKTAKKMHDSPRQFSAVRTLTRKYVESGDGFEELYDLTTDPYEQENKADDPAYARDLAALRKTDKALKSCASKSCWVSELPADAIQTQE